MRDPKDIKIGDFTLEEILERHKHWLHRDCEGWEDMRANLQRADLHRVNLQSADLSCADLRYASLFNDNLQDANLCNAKLHGADLTGANLCNANLQGTSLNSTDLRNASLCNANLFNATLYCANLYGAHLEGADLRCASLFNANLFDANLQGAALNDSELGCANLLLAELSGANGNLIEFRKGKILTENLIGYKKCKDDVIVTLEIPRGAIVFSINGDQCRTNKVKVIDIDGADRAYSNYDDMSYYVDDEITVYNFNCEYNNQCTEGIHFYMTREEAEKDGYIVYNYYR